MPLSLDERAEMEYLEFRICADLPFGPEEWDRYWQLRRREEAIARTAFVLWTGLAVAVITALAILFAGG